MVIQNILSLVIMGADFILICMGKTIFYILSILVPVLTYALVPYIVSKLGGEPNKYKIWLIIGGLLYFTSWFLPSPLIEGRDTSFVTHFVGGGMFTGFVWYYLKVSLKWKSHWLLEAFSLFALVSALGVANELFEIALYALGGMPHGISDTSWDLLANTLGALLFYFVYSVFLRKQK